MDTNSSKFNTTRGKLQTTKNVTIVNIIRAFLASSRFAVRIDYDNRLLDTLEILF